MTRRGRVRAATGPFPQKGQIPPPQPISATKKDIAPKTRDFLGFSLFFAVFLAIPKIAK